MSNAASVSLRAKIWRHLLRRNIFGKNRPHQSLGLPTGSLDSDFDALFPDNDLIGNHSRHLSWILHVFFWRLVRLGCQIALLLFQVGISPIFFIIVI
ncbi:hypothetical protein FHS21_003057 [Phyllobacterium trifolii]|uniref:Uncharacterized protein n=1 Tax=Phyllobacterium trifolii TaxID=300193 RepID=A0A839UD83_9HYPH|nr:hypothetical protein [Phyllobacterium trifolii]